VENVMLRDLCFLDLSP